MHKRATGHKNSIYRNDKSARNYPEPGNPGDLLNLKFDRGHKTENKQKNVMPGRKSVIEGSLLPGQNSKRLLKRTSLYSEL